MKYTLIKGCFHAGNQYKTHNTYKVAMEEKCSALGE